MYLKQYYCIDPLLDKIVMTSLSAWDGCFFIPVMIDKIMRENVLLCFGTGYPIDVDAPQVVDNLLTGDVIT